MAACEKCSTFKAFKLLLLICVSLVFLQYAINLVAYKAVSNIFGFETLLQKFLKSENVSYMTVNGGTSSDVGGSPVRIFENASASHTSGVKESVQNGGSSQEQGPHSDSSFSSTIKNTSSKSGEKGTIPSAMKTASSSHSTAAKITEKPSNITKTTQKLTEKVLIQNSTALALCPLVPPKLVGALATYTSAETFDNIYKENPGLQPGGRFKPKECVARHRVAVVIPYRNRLKQLQIFLKNIHPILQRQQLDYGIYVIDMEMPTQFNRAMLMNIGYNESLKVYDYQCFIFHDVDLIPENDKNIYSCPETPRHMSVAIDKFGYKLPYASIFGGVSALTREQMIKTNGFSNKFFGWGGEDDDMYSRIRNKGYKISRYSVDVARYRMIKHQRETSNPVNKDRYKLMSAGKARQDSDGINSLKYKVIKREFNPTHTYILTKIDKDEVMKT